MLSQMDFGLYCDFSHLQRWPPLYTKLESRLHRLLTITTAEFHLPFESCEGAQNFNELSRIELKSVMRD